STPPDHVLTRISRTVRSLTCPLEQALPLPFSDAHDTADLEQRDARSELEHQGLGGLRKGSEELSDPAAVPHAVRWVAARAAPAPVPTPPRDLKELARRIETKAEEAALPRGHRTVARRR